MIRVRRPNTSRRVPRLAGWVWAVAVAVCSADLAAAENPLELATRTQVSGEGRVVISLTLTNRGSRPLFHLHPMFHFHHTMSRMAMIHRLDPGQSLTLENKKHPPVRQVGSYPVVVRVRYRETETAGESRTAMHTDFFYFEEPMVSLIEGKIGMEVEAGASRIKILLKNPSPSFKNVRLMLLLPPELTADGFKGMMGFTLHGGAEKYFEVPVHQVAGRRGGEYPVHLLVEYGEMRRHYSGEIRGEIYFGPVPGQGQFWPQMLVFAFLAATLFWTLQKRFKLSKPA